MVNELDVEEVTSQLQPLGKLAVLGGNLGIPGRVIMRDENAGGGDLKGNAEDYPRIYRGRCKPALGHLYPAEYLKPGVETDEQHFLNQFEPVLVPDGSQVFHGVHWRGNDLGQFDLAVIHRPAALVADLKLSEVRVSFKRVQLNHGALRRNDRARCPAEVDGSVLLRKQNGDAGRAVVRRTAHRLECDRPRPAAVVADVELVQDELCSRLGLADGVT